MLLCAEKFTQKLTDKNLNYSAGDTERGDSVVDFPYKGNVTKCIFSGDVGEYCSMYLVYESIPEEKVANLIYLCNELNAAYKWVTYYVDSDNDLVLHNDAILSPDSAAEVCFELLIRMLKIAEDLKPSIMKEIYA